MSFRITTIITVILVTSLGSLGQEAAAKAEKKDWIQLFNGKSLDGWTVKIAKHKLATTSGIRLVWKMKNSKAYYVKASNTKCVY